MGRTVDEEMFSSYAKLLNKEVRTREAINVSQHST